MGVESLGVGSGAWSVAWDPNAARSVCDAETASDVPRVLDLVEQRDRVILVRDGAVPALVDEELVAGGAVAPSALAGVDLGGGAQEGPVEPLTLGAVDVEAVGALAGL